MKIKGIPQCIPENELKLVPGIYFYRSLCKLSKPILKYHLRIPDTYYAGEGKLLIYDTSKGCLGSVVPILDEIYKNRLEIEASAHANQCDEPAYVFHRQISNILQNTTTVSVTYMIIIRKRLPGKI